MRYHIVLAKPDFRFAAAHMTVFPDGTKERLHGHTFHVVVRLFFEEYKFENFTPFGDIKDVIRGLCDRWHEKTLLAEKNPFFTVKSQSEQIDFELCGKSYALPMEDVEVLPTENVDAESLSRLLATRLKEALPPLKGLLEIEVQVDETAGQGVATRISV